MPAASRTVEVSTNPLGFSIMSKVKKGGDHTLFLVTEDPEAESNDTAPFSVALSFPDRPGRSGTGHYGSFEVTQEELVRLADAIQARFGRYGTLMAD